MGIWKREHSECNVGSVTVLLYEVTAQGIVYVRLPAFAFARRASN